MTDTIESLRTQRDELADALRLMLDEFADMPGMVHDERAACDKARAALAKLEGR